MTTRLFARTRPWLLAAAILLTGVHAASAQTLATAWGNNGYFSFNGLYDLSTQENTVSTSQGINAETATIPATTETGKRPLYDVTAGGRIRGNLGFGFGVTFGTGKEDARVGGDIPHPFYFNQPRTLTGTTSLERTDLMLHLSGMYLIPASQRVQITVFGGPTWFQLKQQVIQSVTLTESFPFDTVALASVALDRKTVSRWGYHGGFDLSYFFSRNVGVQGMVRYSKGTATMFSVAPVASSNSCFTSWNGPSMEPFSPPPAVTSTVTVCPVKLQVSPHGSATSGGMTSVSWAAAGAARRNRLAAAAEMPRALACLRKSRRPIWPASSARARASCF